MKAIITVGISGSGKSTWAAKQWSTLQDYPTIIINRDDTRWKLSGKRGWNGPIAYRFNKDIEKHVTLRNRDKILAAKNKGCDIIISDTNLNNNFRSALVELLEAIGYEVEIKEFPISFQEALRRDAQRGIYAVGQAVLEKQWEAWIRYNESKQGGAW